MLLAVLGLVLFLRREKHAKEPMMPLQLFHNKTFSLANSVSVLTYVTLQLTIYLFPFYLADIKQMPSDRAGLVLLGFSMFMMISSPFGGALTDRFGSKPSVIAGELLFAFSCLLTGFFKEQTGIAYVVFVLVLMGTGSGLATPGFNTAILGSVPREKSGVASGMLATVRNIGFTLGTAIASVMLTMRENHYIGQSIDQTKSYLMAQRDAFYIGVALALTAAFLMSRLPKRNATVLPDPSGGREAEESSASEHN